MENIYKNKHILFLTAFFYPYLNGATIRNYKTISALKKAGYQITIVSPFAGREDLPSLALGRWPFSWLRFRKFIKHLKKNNPIDLVYSESWQFDLLGSYAAKKFGVKQIIDIHGPEKKEIIENMPAGITKKIILYFLKKHQKVLQKATALTVAEKPIVDWLITELGLNKDKMTVIENYPDAELFKFVKHVSHKPFCVGFLGTLQIGRISPLLQTMQALPNFRLKVLGTGDGEEEIKKLSNAELKAANAYEQVPAQLADFDLGVIFSLKPEGMTDKGAPMKFYEYLLAGVPVLAVNFEYLRGEIEGNNLGKVCAVAEIKTALLDIAANYEKYQIGVENYQDVLRNKYSWQQQEEKLLTLINSLV